VSVSPRVVVVRRNTEYDELVARHGTHGQVEFFLSTRGQALGEVERRALAVREALDAVGAAIPLDWRRGVVERGDLTRFLFTPDDVVVVVGQDGLVANVAKYLHGQPVIGVNPDPVVNAGLLCRHRPQDVAELLRAAVAGTAAYEPRAMVQVTADDGQTLTALNEVYVGHVSHQTSRYLLRVGGEPELQASSGIVVGTGTGATGWCRSLWQQRHEPFQLPAPTEPSLAWFVREAWPSPTTRTTQTSGRLDSGQLELEVQSEGMVAFGDGMETDRMELRWGQRVSVSLAERVLRLAGQG
jgi:hypothetical protein